MNSMEPSRVCVGAKIFSALGMKMGISMARQRVYAFQLHLDQPSWTHAMAGDQCKPALGSFHILTVANSFPSKGAVAPYWHGDVLYKHPTRETRMYLTLL